MIQFWEILRMDTANSPAKADTGSVRSAKSWVCPSWFVVEMEVTAEVLLEAAEEGL